MPWISLLTAHENPEKLTEHTQKLEKKLEDLKKEGRVDRETPNPKHLIE